MNTDNAIIRKADSGDLAGAISMIWENYSSNADLLQGVLIAMFYDLKAKSKAEIMSDPALILLFEDTPKGLDRGSLAAWFKTFTPIRVQFKGNGHFERVRVVRKAEWDTDGAVDTHWADVSPERTRAVRAGNLAAVLKSAAREASRAIYAGEATPEVLETIRSMMAKKLADAVSEHMASEAFSEWAAGYDAQKEAEAAK